MSDTKRLGRGDALRKLLEQQATVGRTAPIVSSSTEGVGQTEETQVLRRPAGRSALFACLEKRQQDATGRPTTAPPRGRAFLSQLAAAPTSSSSSSRCVTPSDMDKIVQRVQNLSPRSVEQPAVDLPPREPVIRLGTTGEKVNLTVNYVRLDYVEGKGLFQYDVQFSPEVDAKSARYNLIRQRTDVLGVVRQFDGHILYLPYKLPQKDTILEANLPTDNTPITMVIKFVRQRSYGDREALHLYNVLLRKIMMVLGLAEHGNNFFDPKSAMPMPMHRLEVWPGYVTTVDEFEDGLMLCCDASHRVLRNQTVSQLMYDLESSGKQNWRDEFVRLILGQSVLTRYNNQVYKIDDISFDESPRSTFLKSNGEEMSYVDYYFQHYGLKISDLEQPLIKSKYKRRIRGKESQLVSLVPELCYLTGITDEMRADHKVMKDITQCINLDPKQRNYAINKFVRSVKESSEASQILSDWGLSLDTAYMCLPGRVLPPESIIFGGNVTIRGNREANWSGPSNKNRALQAIEMTKWAVVCTRRDEATVKDFVDKMCQLSPQVGLRILKPRVLTIPDDKTDNYLRQLRSIIQESHQIVMAVLPLARNDKYSAIKKFCCVDEPIASQVMLSKTVRKGTTARAIPMKVAFQMNCKLGGTLWRTHVPLKNTMVLGLDAYHDPRRKSNSVGALVCSLDQALTHWYSKVFFQTPSFELSDELLPAIIICLMKWKQVNGDFPDQIIFYRDGVSDGQLPYVKNHEIAQIEAAFKKIYATYEPKFLYVVVQKRINTRMLMNLDRNEFGNPPPGTVLDHTVTRRYLYDFYLVSQHVTQGTVSPTHYIVVHNTTNMSPDQVQRLSFMLTHLYYNWPGTIRVPAPCQYAHKLAYLIGESVHKEAADILNDKLYYL